MRPLRAEINLTHLKHNYLYLKKRHGGQALAVLKADAYGHGAVGCAAALAPVADGFAVAYVEEAVILRRHGITAPILVLEGVFTAAEYDLVAAYQLMPVIHQQRQLTWLREKTNRQTQLTVWIKTDSGMHRSGFNPAELAAVYQELTALPAVAAVVNMTHFSHADEVMKPDTGEQFSRFTAAAGELTALKSVCNSAAILYHPDKYQDYARIGISLYGIDPITANFLHPELRPVMTLVSEVIAERILKKGESIGYGGIFTAPADMRVGLVACGYADGYPRLPSHGNPVLVGGSRSRVLGRVSMDLLSVELTAAAQGIGSPVELWGEKIAINEIARRADTIPHEILCHLKRASKVFVSP